MYASGHGTTPAAGGGTASVALVHKGRVLLTREARGGKTLLNLPGGKAEAGDRRVSGWPERENPILEAAIEPPAGGFDACGARALPGRTADVAQDPYPF